MRKYFLFIILGTFSLLVIGCGNEENNESSEDAVELEMYSWRTEDKSDYEEIIEEFEEENPNIKINFKPYDSTEYNTILTNALVSGEGPDLAQLRPYSGTKTIADNDYLVPLDDVEGIDEIDEVYLTAAKGSDDNIYGVPLTLNAGVIFYNESIFDEHDIDVPNTWEEFLEVSEQLKENDVVPVAQGGRDAYLLSMLHGVISPTAYGEDFVEDVENGDATLTDDRMVSSLERMEELEEYLPEDFIALNDDDAQAMFYAEEAAMYINGDYRLETFESNIPDIPINVIPGFENDEGEVPVTTWIDGSYGVVEGTEYEEEALKFIEFMASKEFGQSFSDKLNRVSAIDGVEAKHEIVQKITEASEAKSTPYLMLVEYGEGSPSTKTIFEDALQGMFLDEITKEELLQDSQENAEKVEEEEIEELEMIDEDDD